MKGPLERTGRWLQGIGLFISGAVIGSAFFMGIYNRHLDLVLTQNRELVLERKQLMEDNANLKKTKNQYTTINLLNVHVEPAEGTQFDKVVETELQRLVHGDMRKVVVGQKISNFAENHELFRQILAEKTYAGVLDKDYVVTVRTMVLVQTELKVWVTAREWKRLPAS